MTEVANLVLAVTAKGAKKSAADLDKVKKSSEGVAKSTGKMGTAVAASSKMVALGLAGIASAAQALGQTIRIASEFEVSMSKLGAISRATGADLKAMEEAAKSLGGTTSFSASQAAQGLTFLAMAGFDAKEAVAAIPAVLDLAKASSMDLGQTADITSNIMSGFGLAATDAGRAADVLTLASSSANTNVSQLGEAMKFVGPVAQAAGISVEEAAAAVGALSDAGIQGGMAGTSLRNVLSRLIDPPKEAADAIKELGLSLEQVNPETSTLAEIFGLFEEAGMGAAEAMRIFGMEGGPAALALQQANERIGELTGELEKAEGAAKKTAEVMGDNLRGDMATLISAAQALAIEIGEAGLIAVLRGLVAAATGVVRFFGDMVGAFNSAKEALAGFFAVERAGEGPLAAVTQEMGDQSLAASTLQNEIDMLGETTTEHAIALLNEAKAAIKNAEAFREMAIAKAMASDEYQELLAAQQEAITNAQREKARYDALLSTLKPGVHGYDELVKRIKEAAAGMGEASREAGQLGREMETMLDGVRGGLRDMSGLENSIANLEAVISAAEGGIIDYQEALKMLRSEARDVTGGLGEIKEAAREAFSGGDAAFNVKPVNDISKAFQGLNAVLKAISADNSLDILGDQFALALSDTSAQLDKLVIGTGLLAEELGLSAEEAFNLNTEVLQFAKSNTFAEKARILRSMAAEIADAAGGVDNLQGMAREAYRQLLQAAGAAAETSTNVASLESSMRGALEVVGQLTVGLRSALNVVNNLVTGATNFMRALGGIGSGLISMGGTLGKVVEAAKSLPVVGAAIAKSVTPSLKAAWGEAKTLGGELLEAARSGKTLAEYSEYKFGSGGGGGGGRGTIAKGLDDTKTAAQELAEEMGGVVLNSIQKFGDAFGDLIYEGLSSFKDFGKSIVNIFKRMIADLIAISVRNKILVSLGITGSTGAAAAGKILAGGGGGGGGFGGLIGNIAGFGASVFSGASGLITAMTGAGGGLAGAVTYLKAVTATATTSLSAFGAAIGAWAGPLAIAVGLFSLFKSKTKLLDSGIRITVDGLETLVETFQILEKKRFFSKKIIENFTAAEAEIAEPIITALDEVKGNLRTVGESIGLEADSFASFSHQLDLSLKGLSDEEAQAKVINAMEDFAEAYAGAALGWFEVDAAMGIVRAGETWKDTLIALATSIELVNSTLGKLGFAMFDASVAGAQLARNFADAFGGWEGFAQGVQSYVEAFYSDGEKLALVAATIRDGLDGIDPNNVTTALDSRKMFKALTDWAGSGAAADPGQANLFAKLINVAPLVDQFFTLQEAIDATASAVNQWQTESKNLQDQINELTMTSEDYAATLRAAIPSGQEMKDYDEMVRLRGVLDDLIAAEKERADVLAEEERQAGITSNLTRQILELQGDTNALRQLELVGLSDANIELKERIWALQEAAEADREAARAAADLERDVGSFFDTFFSDADKISFYTDELTQALSPFLLAGEINTALKGPQEFLEAYIRAGGTADSANTLTSAAIASVGDMADALFILKAPTDEATGGIEELTKAEIQAADLTTELARVTDELNSLTMTSEELRGLERDTILKGNEAIWDSIQATKDKIKAERDAASQARTETGLWQRYYSLIGNTEELRKIEKAGIPEALHNILEMIYAVEDELADVGDTGGGAADAIDDLSSALQDAELALTLAKDGVTEYRAAVLETLPEEARENQKRIWGIEDQIDAINLVTEAEAELEQQRLGMVQTLTGRMDEYLRLSEGEEALRAAQLARLPEEIRGIQEQIWATDDLIAAHNAAAEAARAEAREKEAQISEETRLLRQLWGLQGETQKLRDSLLEDIFPGNRWIQLLIWELEDLPDAAEGAVDAVTLARNAMYEALSALRSLINTEISRIRELARVQTDVLKAQIDTAQGIIDAARASLDNAMDVVRASIAARRSSLTARYQASLDSLSAAIDRAGDSADRARSIFALLNRAAEGRGPIGYAAQKARFTSSQSYISSAAATGRFDEDELGRALDMVAGGGKEYYASFAEYAHAFNKTSAAINNMAGDAEENLTTAEMTVNALEQQLASVKANHVRAMNGLDMQLEQAEGIYSATLDQTVEVTSVREALDALRDEAAVYHGTEEVQLAFIRIATDELTKIESEMKAQIGILQEQLRIATWAVYQADREYNILHSINRGISNLRWAINEYSDAIEAGLGEAGVPGFAGGGDHLGGLRIVGEQGPEIEATGPARYYSAANTSMMVGSSDKKSGHDPRLLNEVRQLREAMTHLQGRTAVTTKRHYDLVKRDLKTSDTLEL